MSNGSIVAIELGVSSAVSTGVSLAVSAEPLLTALITLGVSIVTLAGGELVKFLVAFLQAKTKKYKDKEDDDNGKI